MIVAIAIVSLVGCVLAMLLTLAFQEHESAIAFLILYAFFTASTVLAWWTLATAIGIVMLCGFVLILFVLIYKIGTA